MSSAASDDGATVIDLLIVLVIIAMVSALSAPAAASAIDATRARHAAGFLASRFRLARQEAVARGVHVGVVFDLNGARWSLRVCRDGSRNGLRRVDIQSGADPCFDGPHELGHLFPSVDIAVDATLRGPAGEPGSPDPVRFGTANLVSFSPLGSCTAGSLFFRSGLGAQYVVRVAGVTGRVRILRYETGAWTDQ
jgi:type II secretory pathway pseudopilin PulG